MNKTQEALKLALEKVQEFKARWWKVPPFGNKVNKATREAITNAHSPIFELENTIREALAEQPAQPKINCKHRRENNGVCPHHNLHCGWPKCNEPEQPVQQQEQKLEFVSPGGGYVPAIPRPMPLDWKLVPRKATPEMLKAMDECAQEGYDERLYEGMASSVYMAAWDASPVMGTLPEQPAQQQEPVAVMTVLHLKDRTEIGYGPALAGYDLPTGEYKLYTSPPASKPWVGLMRGVRVEGDTVIISVKGGNDNARELCGELLREKNA